MYFLGNANRLKSPVGLLIFFFFLFLPRSSWSPRRLGHKGGWTPPLLHRPWAVTRTLTGVQRICAQVMIAANELTHYGPKVTCCHAFLSSSVIAWADKWRCWEHGQVKAAVASLIPDVHSLLTWLSGFTHRDVPYVRMTNDGLISAPGLMIGN